MNRTALIYHKTLKNITALSLLLFVGSPFVSAQDNADAGNRADRRSDRGSDGESGRRRGFGGERDGGGGPRGGGGWGGEGGGGPRGGWGGGSREGGGGPRGGGGWGGEGGGPGGGAPWGGGPGGGGPGGAPWGGGPGGGAWGGGGRGGDWGRGGGGFDPSAMLGRLDTNNNKQIDLDEMQGPARFILQRMARDNPKIDLSKPIPLSLLGGRGDSEGGDSEEAPEDEPLVPDFTDYKTASPPPGFGKAGELFSVKIQESDQREASERLNRYDRNRDGALDEGELRGGRWQDNPMQYDRNQDGKLQTSELAVRFAKIRLAGAKSEGGRQDENQDRRGAGGWGAWGGGGMGDSAEGDSKEEPAVELWQNRSTFRLDSKETKVQSLPNWFTALDADSDNQVRMQEFTSDWNDAQISEFRLFDLNDDGVISSKECLTAIRNGVIRGTGGTSTSTAAVGQSTASSGRSNAIDSAINELPPEAERWKKFIAGRMIKLDNNKNGNLTGDEWAASEGADFNTVDKDRDGTITVLEFYQFRANK